MIEKAIAIAKSHQGFFGALAGSKKFSLTAIAMTAAFLFAAEEREPWIRASLVLGALAVVAVYVLSQSSVDQHAITEVCAAVSNTEEGKK